MQIYKIIDVCCYIVDENLKKDIARGFARFCELTNFGNVGTEIYDLKDNYLLEKWFIKNNIKYELFDIAQYSAEENFDDGLLANNGFFRIHDIMTLFNYVNNGIFVDARSNFLRHDYPVFIGEVCVSGFFTRRTI